MASGIQALRSSVVTSKMNKPPLGEPHFPIATTLELEPTVFTDSLIKASLMRAARAHELIYMAEDMEAIKTEQALGDLNAADPHVNDIAAELILATLSGKFPRLDLRAADHAMERLGLTELFTGLL